MDEDRPNEDDKSKDGKILTFPSGEKVNVDGVGAGYIVTQTGNVPTPEIVDQVALEEDLKKRIKYVSKQEIVETIKRGASTAETIDVLLLEIAEEISHIKFERRRVAKEGKSTLNYTISRVNGLRNLAELLLKRKEAALAERLDLKSERFQRIFQIWMEFFYESMEKCGIEDRIIDLVFQQMKADMKDWEKKMDTA
jgi:hypothetical protein